MEREPPVTGLDIRAQARACGIARHEIDRIGDEKTTAEDRIDVAIVLGDARPDPLVLRKQGQELQPRVVDVVVATAADEIGIDRSRGHRCTLRTGRPS